METNLELSNSWIYITSLSHLHLTVLSQAEKSDQNQCSNLQSFKETAPAGRLSRCKLSMLCFWTSRLTIRPLVNNKSKKEKTKERKQRGKTQERKKRRKMEEG